MDRVERGGLKIDPVIDVFVKEELTQDTKLSADEFWDCFASIIEKISTKNKSLLEKRSNLQRAIEEWHKERRGETFDKEQYKSFLYDIGYLVEEGGDFQVETQNLDPEITSIPGPQLVVPVMNARFALNAANARWGSLYDALYGTDMIDEEDGAEKTGPYNPVRGDKVIAFAKQFLDQYFSLQHGSYTDAVSLCVSDGNFLVELESGESTPLESVNQFVGFNGNSDSPSAILLKNNNLHVEIQIDKDHSVGATDPAGIKDVFMESAITTIQDCEDSVAAVDSQDKIQVYRNWLGLMKGDLEETFLKGGKEMTRSLNPDRDLSLIHI